MPQSDALRLDLPGTVESVVRASTNGPLLAAAADLWIRPGDVVVDTTYGRGLFWTVVRPPGLITHDLILDGVDFTALPEADATVDVVVFDPPYVAVGGRETSTAGDFQNRYGLDRGPRNEKEVRDLQAAGIAEAARVLRPGGRLLVKCCNYVSSRRYQLGHHHVVTTALALGFEQVDEFIHHAGTGPQPTVNLDGSPRVQQHARRAHSFLCVFRRTRGGDGTDG